MIVAGAIGASVILQKNRNSAKQPLESRQTVTEKTSSDQIKRYELYTPTLFTNTANKRRVLYFYATWCPSCKLADADFTANANNIPADAIVLRVNYNDPDTDNEEKKLARTYGITYQHTFVQIDAQGKPLTTWNGGQTDDLVAKIQ
ncbi:MAG: thioredoxin family protein [Candidatus Gottesmanbacteria bacterium]|nr:thioredoxin family protein [Candidatus Gottesmanbacteria bacterium]